MIEETEKRPLGAFEKAFWLLDYTNPASFAMAIELDAVIPVAVWESALLKAQKRHPNLTLAVTTGINKRLEFQRYPEDPIPLQTFNVAVDHRWESEIENEMALPFDTGKPPLVRAILIQKPKETVFVMVAHHAIADGKGLTFVLRDLLMIISGHELTALRFKGSTDDMLSFPRSDENETGFKKPWQAIANKNNTTEIFSTRTVPQLERLQFSADLTRRTAECARAENTSFHGALCAAAILASRDLSAKLKLKALMLVTPVDERKIFGVQEDCLLSIATKAVVFEPTPETDFWELARFAKHELAGSATSAYTKDYIEFFRKITFTGLELDNMLEAMNKVFTQDIMVTNVGIVDRIFDQLELRPTALWGPIVISGTDNIQTIGAATINGKLCATNFSRSPLTHLLKHIANQLEKACTEHLNTNNILNLQTNEK